MKKFIYCIFLMVVFFTMKTANAYIMSYDTGYGYYVNDVHYDFYMYVDEETHLPLFRIGYETERVEEWTLEETDHLSLTEEELDQIKDYIFYVTDGKSYQELTTRELIGVQAFIWEMYEEKTGIPMRWNCDVGYLVDYEKMIASKKEEFETPAVFTYQAYVGESLSISLLPYLKTEYTLIPESEDYTVEASSSTLLFTPLKEKNYTLELDSERAKESVRYYKSGEEEFIELVKMAEPRPILLIEAIEKKVPYSVFLALDDGVECEVNQEYYPNEEVLLNYHVQDGYKVTEIEVITEDGSFLLEDTNHFVMPEGDVVVHIDTEKIQSEYSVRVLVDEGVTITPFKESYTIGEEVTFSYHIDEEYTLKDIVLLTKEGSVSLDGLSFLMPNSDAVIHVLTEKKPIFYSVMVEPVEGISISYGTSYLAGDVVSFSYQLGEGKKVDSFLIKTKDNVFSVSSAEFVMPSSDVVIVPVLAQEEASIDVVSTTPHRDGTITQVYEVPNTSSVQWSFLIIIVLFISSTIVYAKKCKKCVK